MVNNQILLVKFLIDVTLCFQELPMCFFFSSKNVSTRFNQLGVDLLDTFFSFFYHRRKHLDCASELTDVLLQNTVRHLNLIIPISSYFIILLYNHSNISKFVVYFLKHLWHLTVDVQNFFHPNQAFFDFIILRF
jgi:hypothetical protein